MMRLLAMVLLNLSLVASAYAYTPPKGIPDPADSFSTFGEIDQATPSAATKCPNWPGAETEGCYYIDETSGSCSDDNTYGYTNVPRCSIPEGALAAGAFLYVHAGSYGEAVGGTYDWRGAGTASNPIWITGNPTTKPVLTDPVQIGGAGNASYIVFENFEINNNFGIQISEDSDGLDVNHIIIRNCEMHGTAGGGWGILVGSSTSNPDAVHPNSVVTYTVAYNNIIHDIGTCGSGESDDDGFINGFRTDYTWLLDSTIYCIDGDSVGGGHYNNGTTITSDHYFIGRNLMYGNTEDCIDVKSTNHMIISENTCHDTGSLEGPGANMGAGIVLHYGANNVPVKDAWVLFNKIYSVNMGVGSSFGEDMYVVGNVIYNITDNKAGDDDLDGTCFGFRGTLAGSFMVVDNTCYDYDTGVSFGNLVAGTSAKIHGNIFSTRNNAAGYEIEIISGSEDYVDMDYNRFYASIEANNFLWAGSDHTLAEIQAHSECANCTAGDPGLSNPPTTFTLAVGSACIGANVEGPVGATAYDAFATAWAAFGVTIEKDYAGNARPKDTTWDIGAYEYDPATVRSAMSIGAGAGVSIGSGATMTLY